jgi:molybdopterin molybdotransferase
MCRGAIVVPAATVLAPRHIAALAAVGVADIPVRAPVRVAVITTGDELMPAGATLAPGQIYNSNGTALAALLAANAAEAVLVTHSSDDPDEFRRVLGTAIAAAELVLTSGGVSMGDFEVVKETLAPLGGEFGHVAMQPGGPQGVCVVDGVPVLSFPGNPVSTVVSFEVFLRPVLRELAGLAPVAVDTLPLTAALRSPAGKRQFLRGRRTSDGVEPIGGGSHHIVTMAAAEVLIDVPAEVTELPAGASAQVWAL